MLNLTRYDYDDVFLALMKGVEDAVSKTRRGWKPSTDMGHYKQEMEAMSQFTGIHNQYLFICLELLYVNRLLIHLSIWVILIAIKYYKTY